MRGDQNEPESDPDLFNLGKTLIRRSSRFSYAISLLLPNTDRKYFWLWYSYLRWVDDYVDDASRSATDALRLVDRQLDLIDRLYQGLAQPLCGYESFLASLISYDRERGGASADGNSLAPQLHDMLLAMKFDLLHSGEAVDHSDLLKNYEREVLSYLGTLAYFCRIESSSGRPPGASAAIGAKYAHILRDFVADAAIGRFNISRQELTAYGLTLHDISRQPGSAELRRWVAAKARIAMCLLDEGLRDVATCSSFRYRAIVNLLAAKYQTDLDQLYERQFLLGTPDRNRNRRFVLNAARNVATAVRRNLRHPSASVCVPRRIRPLLAKGTVGRLPGFLALLLSIPLAALAPILIATRNDQLIYRDRLKMLRRFFVAYQLGRHSFEFVNSSASSRDLSHAAGILYGYWAVSIIALDRHIDNCRTYNWSPNYLCDIWLGNLQRAVDGGALVDTGVRPSPSKEGVDDRELEGRDAFSVLARVFTWRLAAFCADARNRNHNCICADEFLGQAQEFLSGQILSDEQRLICADRDWKWYVKDLLNQKTLGFFLAPLPLWCFATQDHDQLAVLTDAFLTLNAAYLHWQLLDDIADMIDDTANGLITAPGYLLLSQGALARAWLVRPDDDPYQTGTSLQDLRYFALDSLLICDWFKQSPLLDGHRAELESALHDHTGRQAAAAMIVRCAVANTADELGLSLPELCSRRAGQAQRYTDAMTASDWHAAYSQLDMSRAAHRIMVAVNEEARRTAASIALTGLANRSLDSVLRTLEMLMLRAYSKAVRSISDTPAR